MKDNRMCISFLKSCEEESGDFYIYLSTRLFKKNKKKNDALI